LPLVTPSLARASAASIRVLRESNMRETSSTSGREPRASSHRWSSSSSLLLISPWPLWITTRSSVCVQLSQLPPTSPKADPRIATVRLERPHRVGRRSRLRQARLVRQPDRRRWQWSSPGLRCAAAAGKPGQRPAPRQCVHLPPLPSPHPPRAVELLCQEALGSFQHACRGSCSTHPTRELDLTSTSLSLLLLALAAGVSALLAMVMGMRFTRGRKFMPAGLVTVRPCLALSGPRPGRTS